VWFYTVRSGFVKSTDVVKNGHTTLPYSYSYSISANHIVTCIPTARQRLSKHILAQANILNNKTSTTRQRISRNAYVRIVAVFSVGYVQSGYKGVFGRTEQD
jgi:hypothetical protein